MPIHARKLGVMPKQEFVWKSSRTIALEESFSSTSAVSRAIFANVVTTKQSGGHVAPNVILIWLTNNSVLMEVEGSPGRL